MPRHTAACTNSRSRMAMNSPRTRRAIGGQLITEIARMMLPLEGVMIATSTIANRKVGMVWKNSVKRISRSSIQPR